MIATNPSKSAAVAQECKDLGITRVWMHRSMGAGSVSEEATRLCRDNGIACLAGGCPLMFGRPSDGFHRFMGRMMGAFGKLPTEA